jgi:hypothetical protein
MCPHTRAHHPTYNASMISEKGGHVVGIYSNYVSERQDAAAMAAILSRL